MTRPHIDQTPLPAESFQHAVQVLLRSFRRMPDRAESVRRFADLDKAITEALRLYDLEQVGASQE